jgi:hypothetical protein
VRVGFRIMARDPLPGSGPDLSRKRAEVEFITTAERRGTLGIQHDGGASWHTLGRRGKGDDGVLWHTGGDGGNILV